MKKFLYFQPEYVGKFKCDGSKCNARCCKGWNIDIDAATYKKYSRIKPKEIAKEITSRMKFNSESGVYVVTLAENLEDMIWQKNSSTFNPNMSTVSNVTGVRGGGFINCCERNWVIDIDDAVYKKYRKIKPKEKSQEILKHIVRDDDENSYILIGRPCPFLTAENLCGIQLNYGEDFLSKTCVTYPRTTYQFGAFFERSLTLTCPVAAELVLFQQEPMKFGLVEVPEKIHSHHGKITIKKLSNDIDEAEHIREVQVAMISILQQRRFTLNQRLIVLGLFLDKLQELNSGVMDYDILTSLVETYKSEEFLLTEMLPLFPEFAFDEQKFVLFMIKFIGHTLDYLHSEDSIKFFVAFEKVLGIKLDGRYDMHMKELVDNFKKLSEARGNFSEKYSTFLENYMINELFINVYPWKFSNETLLKNFAIFIISYKIFELLLFAMVQSGLDSKEDLLEFVNWYMGRTAHCSQLYKRFLELLEGVDDIYLLMATLL